MALLSDNDCSAAGWRRRRLARGSVQVVVAAVILCYIKQVIVL